MTHDANPDNPLALTTTRSRPAFWTRLPFNGWQVRLWTDADGRTLIDVVSLENTLASRLASDPQAAPAIAASWTWCTPGADGHGQCWALAVGRAPTGAAPVVSFTRRTDMEPRDRMTSPPDGFPAMWFVHDGLWAAAATGCYTDVRLTVASKVWLTSLTAVRE